MATHGRTTNLANRVRQPASRLSAPRRRGNDPRRKNPNVPRPESGMTCSDTSREWSHRSMRRGIIFSEILCGVISRR